MKVCVISAIFAPYTRGGAEQVAYAAALAWREAGAEVVVITAQPLRGPRSLLGHWEELATSAGPIKVFRFTPLNLFTIFAIAQHRAAARLLWHGLDMFNLHTYLTVRRVLKRERPNLILTHNLKGLGYTVPAAIRSATRRAHRVPWLHTTHDLGAIHPTGLRIFGQEHDFWQTMPLVRLYARLNAWLFGSPDVAIAPSAFLLREYRDRGFFPGSRTAVVRNPVIGGGHAAAAAPPQALRFLYLGQLEPYKGVGVLLEAWGAFAAAHPEAELAIAGAGSLRPEVERAAGTLPRLSYRGFVPPERTPALWENVRFTVLPTLAYENSPVAVSESLCVGVPVIASRLGGVPELVEDGVNGFLCSPDSASALLEAMERAAAEWERLHRAALALAPEFSLDHYRERLQSFIISSP